ncbi:MFS transporter [Corynebacterium confusum]|uniref:MFS transporter n=1 Tax=uncultured Corynebacterium sp. TaxID=159447 RepID=UPI0025E948F3|nr:MFS transporter [uncultured Corynebacterium sp.]
MSTPENHRPNPREVITIKALYVWVAAVLVYIVAITGRTSFGVAGVDAIERFGVDASRIAVFTSVQVGVYALAQIPTGIAIDRFGPRNMLVVGAVVMGIGQVILGFTTHYWVAIGARVLIGGGDATAFLSVMRILPYWFPLHRTPMLTQVTGSMGQLGQFASAVPFLWLLGATGWTAAFVSLGAVGIIIALAAAVAVADSPEKAGVYEDQVVEVQPNSQALSIPQRLKSVVTSPVAWQAFFIHYSNLFFQIVVVMMWGVPLMTLGMGLSEASAGLVLTINSVFLVLIGPLHGKISARTGNARDLIAVGFSTLHVLFWAWFFSASEPRGLAAALGFAFIIALCCPSANYGFDLVREHLGRDVVATATGLGNMGGFIAGMLGAQSFAFLLDSHSQGAAYEWGDFRYAAWAILAVWVVGVIGILVTRWLRRVEEEPGPRIRITRLPE